jgi:uncharacterized protein (DUF2249 family)
MVALSRLALILGLLLFGNGALASMPTMPTHGLGFTREQWNTQDFSKQLFGGEVTLTPEFKNDICIALQVHYTGEYPAALLWSLLDWVGTNRDWFEVDTKANIPPKIQALQKNNARMMWVLWDFDGVHALAQLTKTLTGSTLHFNPLSVIPQQNTPEYGFTGSLESFRDFRIQGNTECIYQSPPQCAYIHLDYPTLQVQQHGHKLQFRYYKPDAKKLTLPQDFAKLPQGEQMQIVQDWYGYLRYEYAIMVRSFLHSTRGLFDWQPWEWLHNWNMGFVSVNELSAFLKQGQPTTHFTVFTLQAKGAQITMYTDLNGRYYMDITP